MEDNRTLLEEGAARLLEKETLAEADLAELFSRVQHEGAPARGNGSAHHAAAPAP